MHRAGILAIHTGTAIAADLPRTDGYARQSAVLCRSPIRQCISDMTAEVIGDYFKIEKEEAGPLDWQHADRRSYQNFSRGQSTLLEPWRVDTPASTSGWTTRCKPTAAGRWCGFYRPKTALDRRGRVPRIARFAAARALLVRCVHFPLRQQFQPRGESIGGEVAPLGWISKGRDAVLEQRILGHLLSRAQELREGRR